jgi:hypothetical protein
MTALPVKFIRETLEACPAASKILLLDACHSGKGRDLTPMTTSFAANLRVEGVTILTACKVSEVAHEDEEIGHGIFSYHLAKGLEGAAADSSGVVTVDGLYRHAHREVAGWAHARGVSQTPWRLCEGVGDPVLAGRQYPKPRQREAGMGLSVPRFHYGSVVPVEYYIDRERELADAQELRATASSYSPVVPEYAQPETPPAAPSPPLIRLPVSTVGLPTAAAGVTTRTIVSVTTPARTVINDLRLTTPRGGREGCPTPGSRAVPLRTVTIPPTRSPASWSASCRSAHATTPSPDAPG